LFVERERGGAIYVENREGCMRNAFHEAILVVMAVSRQVAMETDQLVWRDYKGRCWNLTPVHGSPRE
jgi:hypothetical protein